MRKIEIETIITGQLSANCYLVYDSDTHEAAIIDPGDDAGYIQQYISDLEVVPTVIVATHGHFDHVMAVRELQLAYRIPFLIHSQDEFLLQRLTESAAHFTSAQEVLEPKVDGYITTETPLTLAGEKFTVLHTPGHTPGSVTLYSEAQELVIVGDVLFAGGNIGRYDFSYSDVDQLQESIKLILQLNDAVRVFSGHGPETTVGLERHYHEA